MAKNKYKKNRQIKKSLTEKVDKICIICEKPHRVVGKCCPTCRRGIKDIKQKIKDKNYDCNISIQKLIYIKINNNVDDVISFVLDDLTKCYTYGSTKAERKALKKSVSDNINDNKYNKYVKWNDEFPSYIKNISKDYDDKEFLTLSGDRLNPTIHYLCKKCNEEQAQTYKDIIDKRGHGCTSSKSSGEYIVEQYLKHNNIEFKTQRDTLKCINPLTGYVLPYDIELQDKKIIIEIQGDQHSTFTPYFHGTLENFEYQLYKDEFKRDYAESVGYEVIYIYYSEINDSTYTDKLKQLNC